MMDNLVLKSLLLLLLPLGIFAQQPLNLNFEKTSVEGLKRPWGWDIQSWWDVDFKMDSTVVKKGRYSLHARCKNQDKPFAKQSSFFQIEPLDFRNQEVSFLGSIKGERLEGAVSFTVLYSRYSQETDQQPEQEVNSDTLSGTFDWQELKLRVKLPEDLSRLKLRINYQGTGEVWFDEFKIFIEDELITTARVAEDFSKSNIDWLIEKSIPFHSPLPISSDNELNEEDLSFFKTAVGDATIIALGESTHGTSEFFSLKHKLFQYAVTALGFRVFALEDHLIFSRNIDHYVKTGEGTALESMAGCFGVWQRKEMIKLIEWIRDYNSKHMDDMVSFIGFDIQNIVPSIDRLLNFLKRQDTVLYQEQLHVLTDLKEKGQNFFMYRDTLVKLEWIEKSEQLYTLMLAKEVTWLSEAKNKTDTLSIKYGIQYANLVQQFFREVLHNGTDLYRDKAMAENASWYLEEIYPEAKMFIWAHDVHISRGDHEETLSNLHFGVSMGSFLSKKYREAYKSFGISTYTGSYRAFKTYSYLELIECPLFKSPKGSWEEAMHQVAETTKQKNLFLSLPRSEAWLNKRLPLRFANHVSFDYGYWGRYAIPYQFDGIFFIDKTSSSQMIEN